MLFTFNMLVLNQSHSTTMWSMRFQRLGWVRCATLQCLLSNLLYSDRGEANVTFLQVKWRTEIRSKLRLQNRNVDLEWSEVKVFRQCALTHLSCMLVWEGIELTMVHEAIVAEPYTQHHSILTGWAVSLGKQVNDAHRQSDTMPVYTF